MNAFPRKDGARRGPPGSMLPSSSARARLRYCAACFAGVVIVWCVQGAACQAPPSWPPISKEELELKDNSLDPGEAAMVLYHEVQTDGTKSLETHYTRIKIFKAEGKKYADVEIPYVENRVEVQGIQARTVSPDGSSTAFSGEVFDKVMVKARRFRVNVKAFTLPNVQAGSIVEYSYSLHWRGGIPDVIKHPGNYILSQAIAYPAAHWAVDRDLFVRRARFVFRPFSPNARVEIRVLRLPKATAPVRQGDGSLAMDMENIPPLPQEDHSPPEAALSGEVFLFYTVGYYSNDAFWHDLATLEYQDMEKFLSKSKAVHEEAARLTANNDSPDAKLRKIYDRVQQIRFISFEPTRTEKEQKQENLKPNKNVEEVLTRGYAFANEVNRLFVALAREAGFTAYPVRVASRRLNFFMKNVPDPSQLDAEVVEVQLGYKTIYLDPATLHCPFGLLPWDESDTSGIRLDKYPGDLVQIPPAASKDAVTERRGSFRLDKDGNLQGRLEVSFLGQEALERRVHGHNQDEPARKKDLEEEAKGWLPPSATVTLTSATGWQESSGALKAVFEVAAPGFATSAGDRLLLPIGILERRLESPFKASKRENPVYFHYGYQEVDDLVLQVPQGYKVESVPVTRGMGKRAAYQYELSTEAQDGELRFKRNFVLESHFIPPAQYGEMRDFFDFVRNNDDEQAVLHALPAN
jgi:transglutaminase-like putative cysteine protease